MMKGALVRKLKGKSLPEKDIIKKWKILKGDKVEVSFGKDKGKQGEVLRVLRKKNKLIVKDINVTKRHIRKGMERPEGEKDLGKYWHAESPIHYSRLALVDPSTGRGCKVTWGEQDGEKVRIAKKTRTIIPKPAVKYTNPEKRASLPGPKDTLSDVAQKATFDPNTLNPLLLASLEHKQRHLE
eukprot:TRINITY_DN248_c0_g1_i1.p1 TRINITY_DN248_c0_g1~~TRINITY_DN248_c0_g1_i1.p1  ORF type:complete len:183 (-),score=44.66 TRINITY_DN248_c0_g1_i1:14-562(-)